MQMNACVYLYTILLSDVSPWTVAPEAPIRARQKNDQTPSIVMFGHTYKLPT